MSHRLATPSGYNTHRMIHRTAVDDKTGKGMAFRAVKQCKLMIVMKLRLSIFLEERMLWAFISRAPGWLGLFLHYVHHQVIPLAGYIITIHPSMHETSRHEIASHQQFEEMENTNLLTFVCPPAFLFPSSEEQS